MLSHNGESTKISGAIAAESLRRHPVGDADVATHLKHEQAIFLSPHRDDICFSLSGVVSQRQSGLIVNIFTHSEFVKRPDALPVDVTDRTAFVTSLRAAEDTRFAEIVGLVRHDLGLAEASLRGFHPSDGSNLGQESKTVRSALLSILEALTTARDRGEARTALFCPMGIGGHRDHLLTLLGVKEIVTIMPDRFDVFLYEDLQYASVTSMRYVGIHRALSIMSGLKMSRVRLELSPEAFARKLALVSLYESQLISSINAADFIPADAITPTPHEAFWQVCV